MEAGNALIIYFWGVLAATAALTFKFLIHKFFLLVTGSDAMLKNIYRLNPSSRPTRRYYILSIAVDLSLSWAIIAVYLLWSLPRGIIVLFSKIFESPPEEIKRLRFPLLANKQLELERIWANLYAIEVIVGSKPEDPTVIADQLIQYSEIHQDFNIDRAADLLLESGTVKLNKHQILRQPS